MAGPFVSFKDLFEQRVQDSPNAMALVCGGSRYTYSELNLAANQIAWAVLGDKKSCAGLRATSVQRPIVVLLGMGSGGIMAALAVLKLGAIYVQVDPLEPPRRVESILSELSPACVIVDTESLAQWHLSLPPHVGVINVKDINLCRSSENPQHRPEPDHPACIIFTSGSTGRPKGVVLPHKLVIHDALLRGEAMGVGAGDRIAMLSWATGQALSTLILALVNGAALVLIPIRREGLSPLVTTLSAEAMTHLVIAAPVLRALMAETSSRLQLPHLRLVRIASDRSSVADVVRFREVFPHDCKLMNGLASSETGAICFQILDSSSLLRDGVLSVGWPIADKEVLILDDHQRPLPPEVPGRIAIRSHYLSAGYWKQEELTRQVFHRDPQDQSLITYLSGDLGYLRSDGALVFLNRYDDKVKIRGLLVDTNEVRAVLMSHPHILEAVVGTWSVQGDQRLVAWVVMSAVPLATVDLRLFMAGRLASHMVPSAFVELKSLPLTSRGKLDRKALPPPSFAGNLQQRIAPSTDMEHQLHAICAEVLGHTDFGITDNFFAVGGHSLAAARLLTRLEQHIGWAPSLAAFFRQPSIAGLLPLLPPLRHEPVPGLLQRDTAHPGTAIPSAPALSGDWPEGCLAFPASYAQSRLWFLHQLEPHLTAYHLLILLRLQGNLDSQALGQALSDLIERHATLRTSFHLEGPEVLQIIHPPAPLSLQPEPIADRSVDAVMAQWVHQERATPFDLGAGRLIRARLLAIEPQQHLLLLSHHHIASDGWSRSVLLRDLAELYNARCSGQSPELPPITVQYHDFAAWQRQRLHGDRFQVLKDYWIPQLSELQPLELPTDYARPAIPSHLGGSVSFQIPPELLAPFEDLCRSEGGTLQMGLLALLALLLHRYSCQDDFAIGIPIWGRNHPDLEPLIGFFINTLPIRIRFDPGLSFRELLCQVTASSVSAYDHQELPFEQLVEALNLPRDTSRNPLVQVMLQLVELPEASLNNFDGLAVESVLATGESSKMDLSFYFRRSSDHSLRGSIVYSTDLFSSDRMERLSSHCLTLLSSALKDPDASVASLCLLPEGERRLIESWQYGPAIAVPDVSIQQLFAQQVESTPDAIALIVDDQQLSYRELDSCANQLALDLVGLGVGAECVVAVSLERSVELIAALLAILKAGGAYLAIDPAWPQARKLQLLQQSGCLVLIDADGVTLLRPRPSVSGVAAGAGLAYVTTTSGSTGRPKGVAITHAAVLRLVHSVNGFRLSAGQRILQLAPVAFDAATFEIWGPLLNGGTLVLAPPGLLSLAELAALLQRARITTLWLTAGLFHAMVDAELEALAGVSQVLAGGDVLSPAHVQRLLDAFPPGHVLINGYGPSEATTFTCCHPMAAGDLVEPSTVPIGRPIAATHVRVCDTAGLPCPIGIPGELLIGGVGLARGYLHEPELTLAAFVRDPLATDPRVRLYRSGDRVSWNADGTLAFHGRLDGQIKLRGFRIEPGEIEAHLLAHPAVAQAVVVVRHDDPANPRLVAYWLSGGDPTPDQPEAARLPTKVTEEDLRLFLAERLPQAMVPSAFVELERLPLTTNGKVDRKALPLPLVSRDGRQCVEPTTDLERRLHALWVEVLGHNNFGITDNFFAIGGHSLAAVRLMAEIQRHFALELPIATIFHAPEIALMSGLLTRSHATAETCDPCLVPLQPEGNAAPLFVIHGYGGDVFCYTAFARALSPRRPVYGLQALGIDGAFEPHRSVEEMAEHYAHLIDEHWPDGVIHLLGQSAGGWVVWAVATVLLRRGRRLGMVAILDSGTTAAISLRLRGLLLLRRTMGRIPAYAAQLRFSTRPRQLLAFFRERCQNLSSHLGWFWQGASHSSEELLLPLGGDQGGPDYFDLLHRRYRPSPLPLRVHLFVSQQDPSVKEHLWRAMACGGLELFQLFEQHHHFHDPSYAGELAAAIAAVLDSEFD